jgi:Alkylmercury lyase
MDECCVPSQEADLDGPELGARGSGPLIEVLSFDGCPNYEPAVRLVERLCRELGIEPRITLVNVPDQEAAQRLRFLGSPTVRVNGRDVDPYTEERDDFALSCRVFRTDAGIVGQPDERWVRDALVRAAGAQSAIEATGIPPKKQREQRAQRLSQGQRLLYEWILRSFAAGSAPPPDALASAATRFAVDVEEAFAVFAREDLVHYDPKTGHVLVAYPFSGRPTAHRVRIDGGEEVFAMCAIDALGIAPMLSLPVEVVSRDPVGGGEVWVRLDPGEGAWWEPTEAVVLAARVREGPSFDSCCQVLNFFSSNANAERYLREHPNVKGMSISVPDAIEVGRIVFGDILGATDAMSPATSHLAGPS